MHSSVEKEAGDEPTGTNIKIMYKARHEARGMRQDIYYIVTFLVAMIILISNKSVWNLYLNLLKYFIDMLRA